MRDHSQQRKPKTPGMPARHSARGMATGFALLALLLQIIAVTLCPCGSGNAMADPMAQAAMPHCHDISANNLASDASSDHDHGGAPTHEKHTPCPFCSAHCHAPIVFAPTLSYVAHLAMAAQTIAPAHYILFEPARFLTAAASPRGPPALI